MGVLVLLLLAQEIHQLVGRVCCWADHDRHEEAVAEHAFGRHPLIVFLIELRGEMRAERAAWIVAHAHPQHVRPDRKPLVMDIAPDPVEARVPIIQRSEEHTSELQSLMRISYAVFCLKKKNTEK